MYDFLTAVDIIFEFCIEFEKKELKKIALIFSTNCPIFYSNFSKFFELLVLFEETTHHNDIYIQIAKYCYDSLFAQ